MEWGHDLAVIKGDSQKAHVVDTRGVRFNRAGGETGITVMDAAAHEHVLQDGTWEDAVPVSWKISLNLIS